MNWSNSPANIGTHNLSAVVTQHGRAVEKFTLLELEELNEASPQATGKL
jgi:hypothetical protein